LPSGEVTIAPVDLAERILDVPGFPKPDIVYKDITPLLADPAALDAAVDRLVERTRGWAPDLVIAPEARGFLLGPAMARDLRAGFVPARKPGRLPRDTETADYALEYDTNRIEVHVDAVPPGARVLVHDDLLATGGTAATLGGLVERLGGVVVGFAFLVELAFLPGREQLGNRPVESLVTY
jgi:adenine phosphoribosyltransferase